MTRPAVSTPRPCSVSTVPVCSPVRTEYTLTTLSLSFFFPLLLPDLPAYKQIDSVPSRTFGLHASQLSAQLLGSVQSSYSTAQPPSFLHTRAHRFSRLTAGLSSPTRSKLPATYLLHGACTTCWVLLNESNSGICNRRSNKNNTPGSRQQHYLFFRFGLLQHLRVAWTLVQLCLCRVKT